MLRHEETKDVQRRKKGRFTQSFASRNHYDFRQTIHWKSWFLASPKELRLRAALPFGYAGTLLHPLSRSIVLLTAI